MPLLLWLPDQASGVDLIHDVSSVPPHKLVQCDNYYPHGKRWKSIEGNSVHRSVATVARTRHLVEFQVDNGTLGTTKKLLEMRTDGSIFEIGTGSSVQLSGPATSTSETVLWDSTIFTGIMLFTNGVDNLLETLDGVTFAATAGSPPAVPQFVESWKNRVFIVHAAEPLSALYSAFGDRAIWTGTDVGGETITSPTASVITGMRSVENYLAMFTSRTITVLVGDHPDDWTKRTIYEDHGCASHRTIQRANGGLIYANDFGVWMLSADMRRQELSADIRPYWHNKENSTTQRNKARSRFMHSVYDPTPDFNRYYIWVSEGTSTKEDVCWVFNFNNGGWSRLVNFMDTNQTCQASCLREDNSGNVQTYFSSGSDDITTTNKKIYKIDGTTSSFASRTDGNIACVLKSGMLTGEYNPYLKYHSIATMKMWKDFFGKSTATTTGGTTLAHSFDIHQTNTKFTTPSMSVNLVSATSDFIRSRVPISREAWGVQIGVSRTGQVAHSFMGGIFDYEDKGAV